MNSGIAPAMPSWQLGYVSPLPVVDAIHYEFYQTFGSDGIFIAYPLPVGEFSAGSVEEGLGYLPKGVEYLRQREVDRIIIGGMPVSAFAGRSRMLDLMSEMSSTSGVAVTSDVEDIIACLKSLGVNRVALAAKWKADVLRAAEDYFTAAGFDVLGSVGADFNAAGVSKVVTTRSVGLAVKLGLAALGRYPEAEALVLGGGTWLAVPASLAIESETLQPVVSNTTAMFLQAGHRPSNLGKDMERLRMFRQ